MIRPQDNILFGAPYDESRYNKGESSSVVIRMHFSPVLQSYTSVV